MCLAALIAVPLLASGAVKPMQNAVDALARGEFTEAAEWFAITKRDFPARSEGNEAVVHRTMILLARELSSLRLASLWREAAKFSKIEGRSSDAYLERAAEYVKRAREVSGELQRQLDALLSVDPAGMQLRFAAGVEGWDVISVRARLEKGGFLERADTQRLERGEFLVNYAGILGTVLNVPAETAFSGSYEGLVMPSALLLAVGIRLFLSAESAKDTSGLDGARRCFERVLELTKDAPYDKARLEAQTFLGRM